MKYYCAGHGTTGASDYISAAVGAVNDLSLDPSLAFPVLDMQMCRMYISNRYLIYLNYANHFSGLLFAALGIIRPSGRGEHH